MSVEKIKEQISGLWEREASEILERREQRTKEADGIRRALRVVLGGIEESKRLKAEAEPLVTDHSKALLEDDVEKAEQIKGRHKELLAEADAAFERANDALQGLLDVGVDAADFDGLERAVAGRCAALEAQSPEEIETVERVLAEAGELQEALQQQARPFFLARTTGTEQKQAAAYTLRRAG